MGSTAQSRRKLHFLCWIMVTTGPFSVCFGLHGAHSQVLRLMVVSLLSGLVYFYSLSLSFLPFLCCLLLSFYSRSVEIQWATSRGLRCNFNFLNSHTRKIQGELLLIIYLIKIGISKLLSFNMVSTKDVISYFTFFVSYYIFQVLCIIHT
jgi:hypothetical protein